MNPVLALIIANVIWGMASPIFKFALTNIPPFTLAFIRFFFAGLIFLPMAIKNWQRLSLKQFFEILLVGFFGITMNITFFFLGIVRTESINAPIIASSGPVFIYLLSIFFLREKPKSKVLAGMLVSLLGVLLIIMSDRREYIYFAGYLWGGFSDNFWSGYFEKSQRYPSFGNSFSVWKFDIPTTDPKRTCQLGHFIFECSWLDRDNIRSIFFLRFGLFSFLPWSFKT